MKIVLVPAALLSLVLVGCGGGGAKPSEPTLAKDSKPDPRLQPTSAGGTTKPPVTEK
jgi:hypothetical protein